MENVLQDLKNHFSEIIFLNDRYKGLLIEKRLTIEEHWHKRINDITLTEVPKVTVRIIQLLQLEEVAKFGLDNADSIKFMIVLRSLYVQPQLWIKALQQLYADTGVQQEIDKLEISIAELKDTLISLERPSAV